HSPAGPGHVELTRLLPAQGARPETAHDDFATPLMTAIHGLANVAGPGSDHLGVMAGLIDAGARVDGPDPAHRPLHLAVRLKLLPAARLFIERGAAVDLADAEGKTAVQIAREAGQGEMVELLG